MEKKFFIYFCLFFSIFSFHAPQGHIMYNLFFLRLLKGRIHEKPKGFSQSHSAKKVAQPLCVRAFRLL
jgi:hypothetical protein